jgi:hypothetical protein
MCPHSMSSKILLTARTEGCSVRPSKGHPPDSGQGGISMRIKSWKCIPGSGVLALLLLAPGCGGGGGGSVSQPPTPPAPTVTVKASPTTVTAPGQPSTLTIQTTGATNCSISGGGLSGSVPCNGTTTVSPTLNTAYTIMATGDGGSASASVTVLVQLAITVAASATTVNAGGAVNITATVIGGDGNASVTWSANPAVGSFSPTTGASTTWTAPSSSGTVTITATATDGTGSSAQTASATVTVTVTRVITITLPQPIPNNEIYSDFGMVLAVTIDCTGCETGDNLTFINSVNPTPSQPVPYEGTPWVIGYNSTGNAYIPQLTKTQVVGTDGAVSNTLLFIFDGSQNVAAEDPSSGEIYYDYSGNGTTGSGALQSFTSNGTPNGTITGGGGAAAIAVDGKTVYLTQPEPLASGVNGIVALDVTSGSTTFIPINDGEPLAIDAGSGLVCVTIPTGGGSPNSTDAVDCHNSGGTFAVPGIPSGSEPTAIKVVDSSHIVVSGRGDQTLRWYTISGTTATAAGTLQLQEFTLIDANYWKTYPATGGWYLVEVGSTLGVMGQVVNGDGTVGQKLALVNNTTQALSQYVNLPAGTIHVAADPTNNAVVAEYPDFTVTPPITRFEQVHADTGNSTTLGSTSNFVPGAGLLVTQDGKNLFICVGGTCGLQPNQ